MAVDLHNAFPISQPNDQILRAPREGNDGAGGLTYSDLTEEYSALVGPLLSTRLRSGPLALPSVSWAANESAIQKLAVSFVCSVSDRANLVSGESTSHTKGPPHLGSPMRTVLAFILSAPRSLNSPTCYRSLISYRYHTNVELVLPSSGILHSIPHRLIWLTAQAPLVVESASALSYRVFLWPTARSCVQEKMRFIHLSPPRGMTISIRD